ncbi:hypothetical protein SAMN05444722_0027 [Rhodovulum sp. ES.010]|uniref:hypothetical protein n=1 Tax=Rhodovulum sp. ES.010 TaxID=1882821 RepID=UPI00092BD9B5|nr:hypothetical protein [Rhodovulum sp. ES.010]SIN98941.1 hypothetical protein SAMN05444722_0027 [Rhodovulum sp. ES.010]
MSIGEFRDRLAASKLSPDMRSVCLAVTDVLSGVREGDGAHLGFSFFYERLDNEKHRKLLLPALSILATSECPILEIHGYLEDAEEGQLHLSTEEFRDLMETGVLAHPISGEIVEEPMAHVRIFYSLKAV